MNKDSILDRLMGKLDAMDSSSMQAYISHLAKEKGFLESIFNTIAEGILVIDRKLNILYYNKSAIELLGLPENTNKVRISQFLNDINWKKLLHLDLNEWTKVSRQEIEILYPTRKVLQFYLVPHSKNKKNATVILNDVTESRNKTLNQLESEKIHIVSMLAASVAHEIGNPLNSLSLHMQLMKKQLDEPSVNKKELKELLTTALDEVNRLDTIINQFLGAVKPTNLEFKLIDIKNIIITSLEFMKMEIENRSINIKCECPELIPNIKGDESQLKQVFYNIFKNALEAMPEGGDIEITCSYNDDFVETVISDTGQGINIENISKIFKGYHTSKKTGTGLGLMIVERIIREHNAELTVNSEEGKGASFIIRFPRNQYKLRLLGFTKK